MQFPVIPSLPQPYELLAVLAGLKRVCGRVVSSTSELAFLRNFAVENHLCVLYGDNRAQRFAYIAQDEKFAHMAKVIEAGASLPLQYNNGNKMEQIAAFIETQRKAALQLGSLFGYPECCAVFFAKILTESIEEAFQCDPPRAINPQWTLMSVKSVAIGSFCMNFLHQNRLLSHIPCSLECSKSEQIARQLLGLLSPSQLQDCRRALAKEYLVRGEGKVYELPIIDPPEGAVRVSFTNE